MRTRRDILTPAIVIFGVVIVILALWVVICDGQTHTMPGSNVVPSGATLTIQSGGTINAAAGSTVTGFGAGGGAPTTATYITQTGDAGLSAEVPLSGLATGLLKSTITTGALTTITDNSTNWNTAFTQTRQWDGGSTGLVAATGRTSLALVIGTNVQAWDTDLDVWATKTPYAGSVVVTTGKTFTDTNNLTLSGTDGSTLNVGGGGTLGTAAYTASTAYQAADTDLTALAGIAGVRGDVIFYGASGWARLGVGTSGNQLTTNGAGADPTWAAPGSGGGGTVTATGGALTANSVVLGAGTTDTKVVGGIITDGTSKLTLGVSTTSVGSIALNNLTSGTVTITPATGALSTATMTIPAGSSNPVIADTGTANNFLTAISSAGAISKARPAIANLSDAGTLATWAAVTPGTNVTTWLATPSSANLRGALTDENGTGAALFSGATTPDFTTGFTIGAAAASRKILVGNATNFVPSTETWAVPGASTNNVLKSDGTNWTAAQLAFSNLSGSATAAQMPAYTGDVTSPAGSTVNTLVNIPLTTTIAGVAGTRGDVLYYGASGWAKLGAGTSGNQLTTNGAGADPTWAAAGGGGGGSPGGSDTQVQFNDATAFGGDADFTWNKTTNVLGLASTGSLTWNADTGINRNAAGVVEINNGTAGSWRDLKLRGLSLTGFSGSGGIAALLIDDDSNDTIPHIRLRDASATRYRSDVSVLPSGGGLSFNAYDDTGAVYKPVTFDGNPIKFRYNAVDSVDISATGVLNVVTGYTVGGAAASGKVLQGNGTNYVASTPAWPTAAGTAGYSVRGDGTNFASYPQDMLNSSVSSQSPSTSDVYLTGSNVTVAAGDFKAKGQYRCLFDVTKSAGTGGIVISVRTGTAGTTSDVANLTFTFPAGTSVADVGTFEVFVTWRTVGSGTSAVVSGVCRAIKNTITAAGLWNDTSAAKTIVATVSSGFASNTFTNMGVSFNGGTAFAGTITTVQASLLQ